jgi:hypothetical protein
VHANGDPQKYLVPDEGIIAYLKNCSERMGAAYFQTPRDTVKDFVSLLNMLEQDRSLQWSALLRGGGRPAAKTTPDTPPSPPASDDLTEFRL